MHEDPDHEKWGLCQGTSDLSDRGKNCGIWMSLHGITVGLTIKFFNLVDINRKRELEKSEIEFFMGAFTNFYGLYYSKLFYITVFVYFNYPPFPLELKNFSDGVSAV